MINVSDNFKLAQRQPAKQVISFITDGIDPVRYDDDLSSCRIKAVGNLGTTVMRQLIASYTGSHYTLGTVLNGNLGVMAHPYYYKKTITLDHTKVNGGANLTDHVILYKVTDTDLKSKSNGGYVENGTHLDIRFETTGGTQLAHEIVRYTPTTGELIAYIKIPTLSYTVDTEIYMRFGSNPSASEQNLASLWTGNNLVMHFEGNVNDSSGNGNNGILTGATDVAADIGKGRQFGTQDTDKIRVPNSSGQIFNNTDLTVFARIKRDTLANASFVFAHPETAGNGNRIYVNFSLTTNRINVVLGQTGQTEPAPATITDTTLYHDIVAKFERSTRKVWLYVDGVVKINGVVSTAVTPTNTLNDIYIGNQSNSNTQSADGIIDELRVLPTLVDAGRIITDHNNNHSPSTFYSTGALEESTEYEEQFIDYGKFTITELKVNEDDETTTIKAYDKMYEANIDYDLDITGAVPMTMVDFLQIICDRLDWTLATTTFTNSDYPVVTDKYVGIGYKFRDVLDDMAEIIGGFIGFDGTDALHVKEASNTSLETLTLNEENTLKLQTKWGGINSVVAARDPQNDFEYLKDDDSIDDIGLFEYRISNNWLIDDDRETAVIEMYAALHNLYYYPFECDTIGLGYFEVGDCITVKDIAGTEYLTWIFEIDVAHAGGMPEKLKSKVPANSNLPTAYLGPLGERIVSTEIKVDKQAGEISLLVDEIQGVTEDITELTIRADAAEIAVAQVGGSNLIKNSVGLKGTLEEWQLLDENGDPIDARNNALIEQTTEVQSNSESQSAYTLVDQFIVQSIPTIVDQTYVLYFRFKKNGDANVIIDDSAPIPFAGTYTDDTWAVFKYQFIAQFATTTIKFEIDDGVNYATITDLICKLGDTNGWMQAPNEVYGKNFRFDKDGFSVTSDGSPFKAVLDNSKLVIYDTSAGNKIVALFAVDAGKIVKLIAQEEFIIRRYENDSKSLRFLPTDTGVMVVINE